MTAAFPKTELNDWLREAAAHNLPERVKELIALGANPYDVDATGRNAFNHAASSGLDALKELTLIAFLDTQEAAPKRRWPEYGINTPSGKYNSTLITYASKVRGRDVVEQMIEAGADARIVNDSGWNLLHAASVMPGRKLVLQLLRDILGSDALNAKTTHEYKTDYNGHEVTYAAGLTPLELCAARLAQDPECPRDLKSYRRILNPATQEAGSGLQPGHVRG